MTTGTGCRPCRVAHRKCDGARPTCGRCTRSGRRCYGGHSAFAVFHTENSYASGVNKRPRGPRSNPKPTAVKQKLTVYRSPLLLEPEALALFAKCHLRLLDVPACGDSPSITDCISKWTSRSSNKALELSLSALALSTLGRYRSYSNAGIQASLKCQEAITSLRAALSDLRPADLEPCLLAVLFMSLYEHSVYQPQSSRHTPLSEAARDWQHLNGLMALLSCWAEARPSKPSPAVMHARRSVLKSILLSGSSVPNWLSDGSRFGEHGFELEQDAAFVRLLAARSKLIALRKITPNAAESQESKTAVTSLIDELKQIDASLRASVNILSALEYPRTHTISEPQWNNHICLPTVYSFRALTHVAMWQRYWTSRMFVNSTILDVLQMNTSATEHLYSKTNSELRLAADHLAASVPFCMGRLGRVESLDDINGIVPRIGEPTPDMAALLTKPLLVACGLRHLGRTQRAWFRSQFLQVGRVIGFGVFEGAASDDWIVL